MHAIAEKLLIWCYTIITLSLILPMEKGTRYNMIHFVNYLKQVGSFSPENPISFTNEFYHDSKYIWL